MKKLIIPALLLAAALSGCSPAHTTTAAPSPNTTETQILTNDLTAVGPQFANSRSVEAAQMVCAAILTGKDNLTLTETAKTAFLSGQVRSVSDKQAEGIVTAVRGNSFCPSK